MTDGPSKIACTEGSNIAQPPGSPGWVDDPTGSIQGSAAHAVSHPALHCLWMRQRPAEACKLLLCSSIWVSSPSQTPSHSHAAAVNAEGMSAPQLAVSHGLVTCAL